MAVMFDFLASILYILSFRRSLHASVVLQPLLRLYHVI